MKCKNVFCAMRVDFTGHCGLDEHIIPCQAKERFDSHDWKKVEDEKPKQEELVLVYAPNCKVIGSVLVGMYFAPAEKSEEGWNVYDFLEVKLGEKVTHWKPIQPPEGSE